ncbi:MAG: transglycosylase domain-containing protein [Sphingomonas sp.]
MIGGALAAVAGVIALDFATMPPSIPAYAQARAQWQPSEAWAYDRDGRLIDSARIDYQARRLAWTPLADVAPQARDTIVAAEDRRFLEHGGVDWWALGGALRDWWQGRRARGASTLSMQVAGFPRARSRRARIARHVGQIAPDARGAGRSRGAGARTRSSRPISTSPASAARRRGSAPPRSACSARPPRR